MVSPFALLFLMLACALLPPAGVPRPEDPALWRIPPADSLVCAAWNGYLPTPGGAAGGLGPANPALALWADPEFRRLTGAFAHGLRNRMVGRRAGDEAAGKALSGLWDLALQARAHPGCVFAGHGTGGLAVRLGDGAAGAAAVVRQFGEFLAPGATDDTGPGERIDDVEFKGLPFAAPWPARWAVADGWLLVAVGEGTAGRMLAGLRGEPGLGARPVLAAVRPTVQVAQPAWRLFVDLDGLKRVESGWPEVLGKGALVAEAGLEGNRWMSRTQFALPTPQGIFAALEPGRLTVDDLVMVPQDAPFALALAAPPDRLLEETIDLVEQFERRTRAHFEDDFVNGMRQIAGIDFRRDLLAHLGDRVVLWCEPRQGGMLGGGLAAAIPLRDAKAFRTALETFVTALDRANPKIVDRGRVRRGVYLEEERAGDQRFWFCNTVGDDDVPFAPAFAVTDDHLLVTLFPHTLRGVLARQDGPPLSLAKDLARHTGGPLLLFVDSRAVMAEVMPALPLFGQVLLTHLQREGFPVHAGHLPQPASLLRHFGKEIGAVTWNEHGLLVSWTGSMPFVDPAVLFACGWPMAVAMWSGAF